MGDPKRPEGVANPTGSRTGSATLLKSMPKRQEHLNYKGLFVDKESATLIKGLKKVIMFKISWESTFKSTFEKFFKMKTSN